MNTCSNISFATTRRGFLQSTSAGFGWLALSALNGWHLRAEEKAGYVSPLAPKKPHHAAKAKRVIFLYMQGGPSHLDTFDWKPEIADREGGRGGAILGSRFKFNPSGKSGQESTRKAS